MKKAFSIIAFVVVVLILSALGIISLPQSQADDIVESELNSSIVDPNLTIDISWPKPITDHNDCHPDFSGYLTIITEDGKETTVDCVKGILVLKGDVNHFVNVAYDYFIKNPQGSHTKQVIFKDD